MEQQNSIAIGSDHAGFEMKEFVKSELARMNIPFFDEGAATLDASDDYPIFSARVSKKVSQGIYKQGIVLCGTGIGASIMANRFRGVRAALCITADMARMARMHNDANVLVIGGKITAKEIVTDILTAWFTTKFEGGRHCKRVEQLDSEAVSF